MSTGEPISANSSIGPADRGDGVLQQQEMVYQQRPDSATPPVVTGPFPQQGDLGAIFERLRLQVEFYFSPLNLSRDTYLRNMLTATHPDMPSPQPAPLMAPISVITNFPKVRAICDSFGRSLPDTPPILVARSLEGSSIVSISPDGAWIGPASQQLPPIGATPPRGPVPQSQFQQGPFHPNPHQHRIMMPVPVHGEGGVQQFIPYGQPPTRTDSPSANSTESSKEPVLVAVTNLSPECNPIEILGAMTTETVRPMSASYDGASNIWYVAFGSEAGANAAIAASSDRTISGTPIHAILKSEMSASKAASVASGSGASVSSLPESNQPAAIPGGPQMLQQPIPMHGGVMGHLPQGYPVTQPGLQHMPMPVHPGGPHYPPGPHYGMPPMPVAPGQHFPPYYNPQMQQMHPYFMQQQGQYLQPYPPPPHHHMGMRFGPGVPPPPPPRYSGPGGPMSHPYQGMQEYGTGGDGHSHHHGHPPRHHGAGGGRGGGGSVGGSTDGGQKKKQEHGNKKKRNSKSQKRDSLGSGTFTPGSDSEGGQRRNKNNDDHGHHSNDDNASYQNSSHGNNRGKGRKDGRDFGDQQRRSYGGSSSSFSRHQRNNNNRRSSNATSPSERDGKDDHGGHREIFSAADFPGLGGDAKSSEKVNGKSAFSGYADALLKKGGKEAEKSEEVNVPVVAEDDVDSITRQTEAMEREILSEFHDLSLIGDGVQAEQTSQYASAEGDTSTVDNDAPSAPPTDTPRKHLPILPGPFPDNDDVTGSISSESLSKPSAESEMNVLPSPATADVQETKPEPQRQQPVEAVVEAPLPPKTWGSKRLFADVIKNKE